MDRVGRGVSSCAKACADITCDAGTDVERDEEGTRLSRTGGWKGGKGGGLLFPARDWREEVRMRDGR